MSLLITVEGVDVCAVLCAVESCGDPGGEGVEMARRGAASADIRKSPYRDFVEYELELICATGLFSLTRQHHSLTPNDLIPLLPSS